MDGRHLLLRVLQGDRGPQPSDRAQVPGSAALAAEALVVFHGRPDLGALGEREAGGRHPDDRVRLAVELHGLADGRGIAREPGAPELVAEDGDLGVPGLVFARREAAAEGRLHAQAVEEGRADLRAFQARRLAAPGQGHSVAIEDGERFERARLRLNVQEVLRRIDAGRLALPGHGQAHQAFGLLERQRP
jgi:hypothetical protein